MAMQQLMMSNAHDVYRKQGILTASPIELIILLFDGLKKNLMQTEMALKKNNLELAHKKLMSAQDIISELINSLDFSIPLSEDLFALYDFILHSLEDVNVKKDPEMLPSLIEIVQTLRDTWQEVGETPIGKGTLQLKEE